MNKAQLIDAMASKADLSKADAKKALDAFITSTGDALKEGDEKKSKKVKKQARLFDIYNRTLVVILAALLDGGSIPPTSTKYIYNMGVTGFDTMIRV